MATKELVLAFVAFCRFGIEGLGISPAVALAFLIDLSLACPLFCEFPSLAVWECGSVSMRFRFFVFDEGSEVCEARGVPVFVDALDIEFFIDRADSECWTWDVRCGVVGRPGVGVGVTGMFDSRDDLSALDCAFVDVVAPGLSV